MPRREVQPGARKPRREFSDPGPRGRAREPSPKRSSWCPCRRWYRRSTLSRLPIAPLWRRGFVRRWRRSSPRLRPRGGRAGGPVGECAGLCARARRRRRRAPGRAHRRVGAQPRIGRSVGEDEGPGWPQERRSRPDPGLGYPENGVLAAALSWRWRRPARAPGRAVRSQSSEGGARGAADARARAAREAALKPPGTRRAQARRFWGAPSGGGRDSCRPAPRYPCCLSCTGRARSRAGVLGPREVPQGPHAARREALERRGGMGCPPWGFHIQGAPRKGGSKGGNPGGGRAARPVPVVAGRPLVGVPGGRGRGAAAQGRGE